MYLNYRKHSASTNNLNSNGSPMRPSPSRLSRVSRIKENVSFAEVAAGRPSSTTSIAVGKETFPLLLLPLELRNQIYGYLFTWKAGKVFRSNCGNYSPSHNIIKHDGTMLRTACWRCTKVPVWWPETEWRPIGDCHAGNINFWEIDEAKVEYGGWSCPQVFRLCRQISFEARDLLFRDGTIVVKLSDQGIDMLLNDRTDLEQNWYARMLRNFKFGLVRKLEVHVWIDTFRNLIHVLRLREVITMFILLVGRSLEGEVLRNLDVHIEGYLEDLCTENQGADDPWCAANWETVEPLTNEWDHAFDRRELARSFPDMAPDIVLLLGPFSLLRVKEEVNASVIHDKSMPQRLDGIARSLETRMLSSQEGLAVEIASSFQVTRTMVRKLDNLEKQIKYSFEQQWDSSRRGEWQSYMCQGGGRRCYSTDRSGQESVEKKWKSRGWDKMLSNKQLEDTWTLSRGRSRERRRR